jgi:hypothetical protein
MAVPSSPSKMVPRPKIEIKNTRDLRAYLVSQMEGGGKIVFLNENQLAYMRKLQTIIVQTKKLDKAVAV